jgi:mycothiol maleylpyruvate isomerase-like protein
MQAILTALEEQHSELVALLDLVDDASWQGPTRCEGWTVADATWHRTRHVRRTRTRADVRVAP